MYVPNAVKVPKPRKPDTETMSEKMAKEYEEKLKIKNKGIDMDLFPEKDGGKKEEETNTYGYERSKRQVVDIIQDEF